jgi:hypothetical protein
MTDRIDVQCPCCGTRLVVEAVSGEILAEERPKPDGTATFERAIDEVRSGERRREDAFSKAFDRTRRLDDLLEKKFEEAKKKAADTPQRPRSPFDLD